MINDENMAAKISDLMLRIGSELDDSVALVRKNSDENEFKAYRKAVGIIMGDMLIEIMQPLYERHPGIKPKELL